MNLSEISMYFIYRELLFVLRLAIPYFSFNYCNDMTAKEIDIESRHLEWFVDKLHDLNAWEDLKGFRLLKVDSGMSPAYADITPRPAVLSIQCKKYMDAHGYEYAEDGHNGIHGIIFRSK